MKILSATDYSYRKVIRVVEDDTIPEWVHQDSGGNWTVPHTPGLAVNAAGALERGLAAGTGCHACRYNWKVREFIFTGNELEVSLNNWGNPVHDGQDEVSLRLKVWDELYAEVDGQLGEHAAFGVAPREAAPTAAPEVEPEFELMATGDPSIDEDGVVSQRYKVLHNGVATREPITASGETHDAFITDRDVKYAQAQEEINQEEEKRSKATAIIRGQS